MNAETRTVRKIDLRSGPGRQTFRLALVGPGNGEDAVLVLSAGYGGGETGDPFTRPPWADMPLRIPAALIPDIMAALQGLHRPEGPKAA